MNDESALFDSEMTSLIDRLASGDLDETARSRLLEWLEHDPRRWRLCGLAFLEAQVWSHSLAAWPQTAASGPIREAVSALPQTTLANSAVPVRGAPRSLKAFGRKLLVAAGILIAFGTGLAARDLISPLRTSESNLAQGPAANPPTMVSGTRDTGESAGPSQKPQPRKGQEPLLAALEVERAGGLVRRASIRIPVVPVASPTEPDASQPTDIPEYVRQQCERRGYKVSLERRYLLAKLPDGQQVVVPVEQFQLNPMPLTVN